ncbi:alkaline phosphatase L [Dyella sp. GSA-30]|nr:alkaline phosphatase L [Dyella sp. GSA-30]
MANTRMKMLAGAVLFCVGAAMATSAMSTTLYGGGATLPAGAYVGWKFQTTTPLGVLTLPADVSSTSIFGQWGGTTNSVQYCQTGSGGGKRVLNGDTSGSPSLIANGVCNPGFPASPPAANPPGFQVPTTAVVQPDFIGSDAPYASSEYATFVANKGTAKGEPVQFPSIAGSIAIVYNNADLGSTTLNLTQAQVCGVFSGAITDWKTLNSSLPSKTINVVFRSDGSGTSFNFGNYLANVCGTVGGGHFQTQQTFFSSTSTASVIGLTALNSSSSKTGVSGNPLVVSTVASTDGTIGYAEAGNAFSHPAGGTPTKLVNIATIGGKDPIADLPASLAVTVTFDKTITGVNSTGQATLAAQTPNSVANCLGIVDPSTYAVQPAANYPIVAVTYLIANQKGNSTDLTALRSFMIFPQNHTVTEPGYAQLTGTGINTAKALTCLSS